MAPVDQRAEFSSSNGRSVPSASLTFRLPFGRDQLVLLATPHRVEVDLVHAVCHLGYLGQQGLVFLARHGRLHRREVHSEANDCRSADSGYREEEVVHYACAFGFHFQASSEVDRRYAAAAMSRSGLSSNL